MLMKKLQIRQNGFSLPEIMLAILLSSMLLTSISALLPTLTKKYLYSYRSYRLEQTLRQVLLVVEKDLRRAGFIYAGEINNAMMFSFMADGGTCLIIRYDLNAKGVINEQDDLFGYRLRQGALEQQRGVTECSGNGWERIVDPEEIMISHFVVETYQAARGERYFMVSLAGRWSKDVSLTLSATTLVKAKNLR